MSLYTSVYWTKRVLVVLSLIIFICGGIRLFQFVSTALTRTDSQVSGFKAENGFGKLDRIVFQPIPTDNFSPTEYRIATTKGNLDADNLYPVEAQPDPLANVYRIIEQQIDLGTTEEPVVVGKKLGFIQSPVPVTSTERKWSEKNKELFIDGQYRLISFSNNNLKTERTAANGTISQTDQGQLQSLFSRLINDLGVRTSLTGYTFSAEYLDYNKAQNSFIPSSIPQKGGYVKVSAKRIYPNLSKVDLTAASRGAYPSYNESNNYFIIPNDGFSEIKVPDNLVELKIYNWPLNQEIAATNPNVQTYAIKTPRQAYNELSQGKANLVGLNESLTKKSANISSIEDAKLVEILNVRIDMYEPKTYSRYIQPVYVFLCEVSNAGVKYQLTYYVSAVVDASLN